MITKSTSSCRVRLFRAILLALWIFLMCVPPWDYQWISSISISVPMLCLGSAIWGLVRLPVSKWDHGGRCCWFGAVHAYCVVLVCDGSKMTILATKEHRRKIVLIFRNRTFVPVLCPLVMCNAPEPLLSFVQEVLESGVRLLLKVPNSLTDFPKTMLLFIQYGHGRSFEIFVFAHYALTGCEICATMV
jgi:hypothetical protein